MTYPEFYPTQLFPNEGQTVIDSFELQKEEEKSVVLIHTLLTNDTVQWMLSGIIKSDILSDLKERKNYQKCFMAAFSAVYLHLKW